MNLKPKESAKTIPGVWNGVNVEYVQSGYHIYGQKKKQRLYLLEKKYVYMDYREKMEKLMMLRVNWIIKLTKDKNMWALPLRDI